MKTNPQRRTPAVRSLKSGEEVATFFIIIIIFTLPFLLFLVAVLVVGDDVVSFIRDGMAPEAIFHRLLPNVSMNKTLRIVDGWRRFGLSFINQFKCSSILRVFQQGGSKLSAKSIRFRFNISQIPLLEFISFRFSYGWFDPVHSLISFNSSRDWYCQSINLMDWIHQIRIPVTSSFEGCKILLASLIPSIIAGLIWRN